MSAEPDGGKLSLTALPTKLILAARFGDEICTVPGEVIQKWLMRPDLRDSELAIPSDISFDALYSFTPYMLNVDASHVLMRTYNFLTNDPRNVTEMGVLGKITHVNQHL